MQLFDTHFYTSVIMESQCALQSRCAAMEIMLNVDSNEKKNKHQLKNFCVVASFTLQTQCVPIVRNITL